MSTNTAELANMKKELDEINDVAEQTYYLEAKVKEFQNKIDNNKRLLSSKLGSRKRWDAIIDKDVKFVVFKDINIDIEFHEDELAKKLDKKIYRQLVNRDVMINDLEGLIK